MTVFEYLMADERKARFLIEVLTKLGLKIVEARNSSGFDVERVRR